MRLLMSRGRRKILRRKIEDFWTDFSRNKIGLVGIALILFFVLIAILAPWLTPYDPIRDKGLAEEMAPPYWITIFPQFRNLPPTIMETVNFVYESPENTEIQYIEDNPEISRILSLNESVQEWIVSFKGNTIEPVDVYLIWNFSYTYAPPRSFVFQFRWRVKNVKNIGYNIELLIVRNSDGANFSIWDSNMRSGHYDKDSSLLYTIPPWCSMMKMGYPYLVVIDSWAQPVYMGRFKLGGEESLASIIFSKEDTYSFIFHIHFEPKSLNSSCKVEIIDPKFKILGLIHGLLGTDKFGADIFSQLVYGSRISIMIGLLAAVLVTLIGSVVGVTAGYIGGLIDELLMRIVDILLCLPVLPLLITLVYLFGKNVFYIVLLLGLFGWQNLARVIRSQVLSLREEPFIEAAIASGATRLYIMFRHILPNVLPVVFAASILAIPSAILTEAALSFIGMGDPRYPTWGRMLNQAFHWGAFRRLVWWWILPPGLAIMFICLGFVFLGHAVDEIVNPRLRRRR